MSARFDQERFEELRVARALGSLTAAECAEFTALLAERAGLDLEADEIAVAAVELASLDPELAPLPAALAKKLQADAQAHFAHTPSPLRAVPPAPSPTPRPASIAERRPRAARPGWSLVAAAAALILAFVSWWPRLHGTSPEAGREALLAKAEVLTVPWKGTDFAKDAAGDVVWDPTEQRGFMRIRGLAKNDPTREQYQLWIFDETQQHPVDGGVFDVGADGELVIPIDAKLRVSKPTLFAVTVEKPGGVVVSAQEKIVLAGKV
ncbi:MAG: anti-sigma factor [Planctomycetes bacterium]|nr:anti-sigma factor [Planctomycetota bacterium]